jgi:hypothetical protein
MYGDGTTCSLPDLVSWTYTQQLSADVTLPPTDAETAYFMVRAQSAFGFWSPTSFASFPLPDSPRAARLNADGSTVTVTGDVTAVFADSCYVQGGSHLPGIKVIGCLDCNEGSVVTVTGTLTTINGERAVLLQQ